MKGGPWSNRQKVARHGKGKYTDPSSHRKFDPTETDEQLHQRIRKSGKDAVARHDIRIGWKEKMSVKNEPMIKKETAYDRYVAKFGKKK